MLEFNNFEDIQHLPLRAYNRAVFYSNLFEDSGKMYAKEYVSQFSPKERLAIAQTIAAVRKFGPKRVQQIVTEGLEFPEYLAAPEPEIVR